MDPLRRAAEEDVIATQHEVELAQLIQQPILIKYTTIDRSIAQDKQTALNQLSNAIQNSWDRLDAHVRQDITEAVLLYSRASHAKRAAAEQLPWDSIQSLMGKRRTRNKDRRSRKHKTKSR